MKSKKTQNLKLPSKDLDKPADSQKQLQNRRKTSRVKRIRQKNVVYPLSTPHKIVFITNQYGTGFKKQKLDDFDCPAHIPIQQMLKQVNNVCYNQWKIHYEKVTSLPFERLQLILAIIFALVCLIVITYFTLIVKHQINGFEILNNIILALIVLLFIFTVYVCFSRKDKDENLDNNLIEAVQKKLIDFNKNQQENFGLQPRFRWSCHKDCLWIALNL